MKKNIVLTISFIIWTTLCQAFELDTNQWSDFEGTIGKAKIQLSLYRFENGQIKGNYYYKKYENKIQLIGQITGNQIEITEYLNYKPNGHFSGKVFTNDADRFEGIWTDGSNTKSSEFKLTLQSICGNTYEHRYSDLYGTNDDVENFIKHTKTSILKNDKEWIANHIKYPLKTTLNKTKPITIKDKKQLLDNFDFIFHQNFKDEIKLFSSYNLFCNYQGVMFGSGQIWITNKPNSTSNKYDYIIKAINN